MEKLNETLVWCNVDEETGYIHLCLAFPIVDWETMASLDDEYMTAVATMYVTGAITEKELKKELKASGLFPTRQRVTKAIWEKRINEDGRNPIK